MYVGTVFLWPTKHRNSVQDSEQQKRLNAFWEPLTPYEGRFEHLSKALAWCKIVVGRKKRATPWWMVEEEVAGQRVLVQSRVWDWVQYTPEERARLEAAAQKRRQVMYPVWLRADLAKQLQALAQSKGVSLSDLLVKAGVELLKRSLDEALGEEG